MSSSDEPPIRVSDNTAIYRNRNRCEVTIDRRDFEVIKEGIDIGNKKSRAAFSVGLLISSVIGALSIFGSVDLTTPNDINWWPLIVCVILVALVLISGTVTVCAGLDARKSAKRPLLTQLLVRIQNDLDKHAKQEAGLEARRWVADSDGESDKKNLEQTIQELLERTTFR